MAGQLWPNDEVYVVYDEPEVQETQEQQSFVPPPNYTDNSGYYTEPSYEHSPDPYTGTYGQYEYDEGNGYAPQCAVVDDNGLCIASRPPDGVKHQYTIRQVKRQKKSGGVLGLAVACVVGGPLIIGFVAVVCSILGI